MERLFHLEKEIERMRKEMNAAGNRFGLLSFIVLKKSQELDVLLNEYQQKETTCKL